jgi:hypothetical protein
MYMTIEQAVSDMEQSLKDSMDALAALKVVLNREQPENFQNQAAIDKETFKLLEMSDIRL